MKQPSPLTSLAFLILSTTPLTQIHALPLIDGLRNLVLRGSTEQLTAQDALPLQAAPPQRPISPPQPRHFPVYPDAVATPAAHIVEPRAEVAATSVTPVTPVVPSPSSSPIVSVNSVRIEAAEADSPMNFGYNDDYDYGYLNSSAVPGVAAAYPTGVPGVAAAYPTGLTGTGLSGDYGDYTPSEDEDPLNYYKGPGAISPGPSYDPMQGYGPFTDDESDSDNGDVYRTGMSGWSNQDDSGDSSANDAAYGQDDDASQDDDDDDDDENYDDAAGSPNKNDSGVDAYYSGDLGGGGAAASTGVGSSGDDFYGILANLGLAGADSTSIPASLTAAVKSIQNLEEEAAELSGQNVDNKRALPADNPEAKETSVPLMYQNAPYLQDEFNEGMRKRSLDDGLSAGKRQRRDIGDILSDDIEKLNARISSLKALPASAIESLQQGYATEATGAEITTAPNLNEKRDWADWASSESQVRGERYSRFLARVSSIKNLPPAELSSYEAAHSHAPRVEWRARLSSIRNLPPAAKSSWVAEHPHLQIHRGGVRGAPKATGAPVPRVKRDATLKNLAERQMMMPGNVPSGNAGPISGQELHQYRETPANVSRELQFEPQPLGSAQGSTLPISPDNTFPDSGPSSNFTASALDTPLSGPPISETPSLDDGVDNVDSPVSDGLSSAIPNNWTNSTPSLGSEAWELMEIQALEEILRNLTLNGPLVDVTLPTNTGAGAYARPRTDEESLPGTTGSSMGEGVGDSGASSGNPGNDFSNGDPSEDADTGSEDFGSRPLFDGNVPANSSGLNSPLDVSNLGSGSGYNFTANSPPNTSATKSAADHESAADGTDPSISADQPQSIGDSTPQGSSNPDTFSDNASGPGQENDMGTVKKRQVSTTGNPSQRSGMGEGTVSPPLSAISLDSQDFGNTTESIGTQIRPPSVESYEEPYRDAMHANFSTYGADRSDPPLDTPANTLAASDSNNPGPQNQPWDQTSQSIGGFPPSIHSSDDATIPAHFPMEGGAQAAVPDAPFAMPNSSDSQFGAGYGAAYPAPTGTGFSMALLSASNVVVEMVETNVPVPGVGIEEILELDVIRPGGDSGDSMAPLPDTILGTGSGAESLEANSGSSGSPDSADLSDLSQFEVPKFSTATPLDRPQTGATGFTDPMESNSTLASSMTTPRNSTDSPDPYTAFLSTPGSTDMGDTPGVHDSAASLNNEPPTGTTGLPSDPSTFPGNPPFKPRYNKIRRQIPPAAISAPVTSSTLATTTTSVLTSTTSALGAAISSDSASLKSSGSIPLRGSYYVGPNTPAQPAANLPNLNSTSDFPPIYERPAIPNQGSSFSEDMPGLLRRPGARHGRHWFPGMRGQRYTRNETERTRELLRNLGVARPAHMSLHETNVTLPGNRTEEEFELDLMLPIQSGGNSPSPPSPESSAFQPVDAAPLTPPVPSSLENSTFGPMDPAPVTPPVPSSLENSTFGPGDSPPHDRPYHPPAQSIPIAPPNGGEPQSADSTDDDVQPDGQVPAPNRIIHPG